jgi:hypothetical protein
MTADLPFSGAGQPSLAAPLVRNLHSFVNLYGDWRSCWVHCMQQRYAQPARSQMSGVSLAVSTNIMRARIGIGRPAALQCFVLARWLAKGACSIIRLVQYLIEPLGYPSRNRTTSCHLQLKSCH